MSVQAISWALAQRLPPAIKLVLISIANCADKNGDNAFPGQDHIAEDASMSVRSVRRHIDWLEQHNYLARIRRSRTNGTRTSDRYVLDVADKRTNCPLVPFGTTGQLRHRQPDTGVRAINRQRNRQDITPNLCTGG